LSDEHKRPRRHALACMTASVGGLALAAVTYYPGYMSLDSIAQLTQARTGALEDWHPPLMSLVWGVLDRIIPGPFGMLLFHNALFWAGVGLVAFTCIRRTWLAVLTIFLAGLYPPIFALLGTIWKDVGLGAALVFAVGALAASEALRSRTAFLAALIGLFYASAVRHNALPAVVPLAAWAAAGPGRLFFGGPPSTLRTGALALAITGGLFGLSALASGVLVRGPKRHAEQVMLAHDLVNVSLVTGQVKLPAYLRPGGVPFTLDELRELYTPGTAVPLFTGTKAGRRFEIVTDEAKIADLRSAWLAEVPKLPFAYMRHRWRAFKVMIGLGEKEVCYPYQLWIDTNDLGVKFKHSTLNTKVMELFVRLKNTLLWRGWLYLLLVPILVTTAAIFRRPNLARVIAVGASAFLYVAGYLFLSVSCDFRYNWWLVVAVPVLLVLLLTDEPASGIAEEVDQPFHGVAGSIP